MERPGGGPSPQRFVLVMATVAAIGGFLFGYDVGVISGALLYLTPAFKLAPLGQEMVTASVLVGALLGALAGGAVADAWGRRAANLASGVVFVLGSLAASVAPDVWLLVAGRVVVGVGVGLSSVAGPLYISEVTPPERRGRMVSLYQLAITAGILGAYLVDWAFSGSGNWRAMFALGAVPGVMLIGGMLMLPNSPRWLLASGRKDEAVRVLSITMGAERAASAAGEIERDLEAVREAQRDRWLALLRPAPRRALVVAVGLAVLQQLVGINTVIYYAPSIFESAGMQSDGARLAATAGVGAVNMLATFIAIWLVDRVGRKPLLVAGLIGMAASLAVLGVAFLRAGTAGAAAGANGMGAVTLACLMLYIVCFAFSMGPIVWLMISEIFPLGVRGLGTSLAAGSNWAANFLVAITFLSLLDALGAPMTFGLFAALGVVTLGFVLLAVPETKGLPLEEIQARLMGNRRGRH